MGKQQSSSVISVVNKGDEIHEQNDQIPDGKSTTRSWHFHGLCSVLCLLTFLYALDATSVTVPLTVLAQDLNGSMLDAFWIGVAYLLGSTIVQPIFASLSHLTDRIWMLLTSIILFAIGSVVAAAAQQLSAMHVGRVIQGVGGGGVLVMTEIVITDIIPLRERGKFHGALSMIWALGTVAGPVIGAVAAEDGAWRWIFWLNLPCCGIALICTPVCLRLRKVQISTLQRLRNIDYTGITLLSGSLSAFLLGLSWGGVIHPWESWQTLVPLLIGIVGLIALACYLRFAPGEHVIRMSVFSNRTSSITYFGTFLHGIVLWALVYFLPLYFHTVRGFSLKLTSAAVLPATLTVAPAAGLTGVYCSIKGHYRTAIILAWAITCVGVGLLCLLSIATPTFQWILIIAIGGIGTGMQFPTMAYAVQAAASEADAAFAISMYSFLRSLGQTVGITVTGVLFQNALMHSVGGTQGEIKSTSLVLRGHGIPANFSNTISHLNAAEQRELLSACNYSIRMVWAAMCALAGLGLFTSLLTKEYSIDRALETNQGWAGTPAELRRAPRKSDV